MLVWQYRTNLFEFTKDGLLGDKYVDDEEMEKTLNELGGRGWELVSVSLLQDGLLVFLKRPMEAEVAKGQIVNKQIVKEQPPVEEPQAPPVLPPRPPVFSREPAIVEEVQTEERDQLLDYDEQSRSIDRQRHSARQRTGGDFIGDIKIS